MVWQINRNFTKEQNVYGQYAQVRDIISHQGNTSSSYNEKPPNTHQNGKKN